MPETKHPTKNDTPLRLYSGERSLSIRQWRNDVYEELNDAGMEKVAERWLSCELNHYTKLKLSEAGTLPASAKSVFVCSGNHHHDVEVYCQTCDLRICPDCARRHSARVVARYLPKILELAHQHSSTHRFRHIIFTLPYALTDTDIREKLLTGFKQVDSVMDKLMTRGNWKKTQGYITGAEFGESGLHLHYHVVHYGQYLAQANLALEWRKATNDEGQIVFVKGFPIHGMSLEDSLREVLKYCTKFFSKDKVTGEVVCLPAVIMPLLAKVLEKTRRIRTAGVFYNLPKPDRAEHLCETCNSPMTAIPIDYFVVFRNTGFLPQEYHAANQPSLNLRPADKSNRESSGIPPPKTEKDKAMQKELGFLKGVRATWDE